MNKKEKDKEEFTGRSEREKLDAGSSISPEIHKKAERIARVLMNTPSRGLKSKKVN